MPEHESRALKALDGLLADVAAGRSTSSASASAMEVDEKLSRYERMKRKVAAQGGAKVLVDFAFARPIPPQPYLCQFVHQWLDFRLPELVAACEATATTLTVDAADAAALPSSTCCRVTLNDDWSARRVAARSVLVKRFIEVWASGGSWDEMVRALAASPSNPGWSERAACIAEGTTFCVRVEAFGRHFSEAEALEHIQKLEGVLPWRGRVRLKGPQHAFLILFELDDAADGAAAAPAAVRRVHFGRVGGAPATASPSGPEPRYALGRGVRGASRSARSRARPETPRALANAPPQPPRGTRAGGVRASACDRRSTSRGVPGPPGSPRRLCGLGRRGGGEQVDHVPVSGLGRRSQPWEGHWRAGWWLRSGWGRCPG